MSWQQACEQWQRPALQGLRQQRMIGMRQRAFGNFPGDVPVHSVLVNQQAHQFGYGNRKHAERNWRTLCLRKPRSHRALLLGMTLCLCTKITRFVPGLRGMDSEVARTLVWNSIGLLRRI